MRVLRGAGGVRRLSPAEMEARRRAEETLGRAERQAEAWRQDALARGRAEARAEEAALLVASRLAYESATCAEEARVVALVLDATRAVWGHAARAGDEVVREAVRRALTRVRRARCLVLRVHPGDADRVRASAREWLPDGAEPETVDVLGDEAIERGGVVVESELGRVDARLDAALHALARALRGEAPGV